MWDGWDGWVIDASLSDDEYFCLVPYEGRLDGDNVNFITGMNYMVGTSEAMSPDARKRPEAVIHPDGQEAVEKWCLAHGSALERFKEVNGWSANMGG